MEFAERCQLKLNKVDNPFPEFAVPAGQPSTATSRKCAGQDLKKRLATAIQHLKDRGLLRKTDGGTTASGWSGRFNALNK